jgi:hypothetical protein
VAKLTKGIPETYDIKKIVEALIQELVKENILQRSQVDLIIEKGRPKSVELNSSPSTG